MWDYRVIKTETDYGTVFRIHEVFYDKKLVPEAMSVDPMFPTGDTLEELKVDAKLYMLAFDQAVLDDNFGGNDG